MARVTWLAAFIAALAACSGGQTPEDGRDDTTGLAARPAPEAARSPRPSPVAPVAEASNEPLRRRTYAVIVTGTTLIRGGSVGVTVESLESPGRPVEVGRLVLPGSVAGLVEVSPGLIAAGCGGEGVFLVDISTPASPRLVGRYDTNGAIWRLSRFGDLLLVADGHAGVAVADFRDPTAPRTLGRYRAEGFVRHALALDERYALVAEGRAGLTVLDLSDPTAPRPAGRLDTDGEVRSVAVREQVAFLADFHAGLLAVDVSEPTHPRALGRLETADSARDVVVLGDHLAVAMGTEGVQLVDATDPTELRATLVHRTALPATRFFLDGTRLVVGVDAGGLEILDVTDPSSPTLMHPPQS